ncbi:DUF2007 domain-containing protein [Vineibacter terrae]|uniref:DUF2007 domain-containing protein n=1 Tax=Vineibacter terrae TaxID=2586908 RepID=A0A5C8PL56_9HYPH|nr:DUF2007 domain-containing protein [Vineibacter terrae]TXL74330.1 DUF2007 domain-containing protein [Vineibacter terrae]HEX2886331.1 DUF2007 domain-containing protein [Vineibacter terrae]
MTDAPARSDELVLLETFSDPTQAHMARGLLDTNGIPSVMIDGAMAATGLVDAVGGVKLKVRAGDLASAKALLADPMAFEEMDWNEQDW